VPEAIAQHLHLHEQADTSRLEQVRTFLQPRQFLLILDNFEHLLDAATFLADLLATCAHLRVLVTSRTRLRLRAEQIVQLAPLSLEEAAALFQERAQAIRPAKAFEEATVAAICERLDRLPLAIELAAMHVSVLSLSDLLERLTIRLPLLRGGARYLPLRQQTMRDAIAWSYELLPPRARQCFRALGVFLGGWTLEAVEAVCWPDGETPAEDPFLTLAALVETSLVQVELSAEGNARFHMLELLREYALERLRASGEEEACRYRHARYYARLAESVAPFGPGPGARAPQLAQDFPNGRAALQWADEHQEAALGLWLAGSFGRFWLSHGHLREAEVWLERMLALDRLISNPFK
jgi:predicted ATPase